jgi:membrane protein
MPNLKPGPGESALPEGRAISSDPPAALPRGFFGHAASVLRYLTRTDVHTYAFSVAANAILSLFPFIVLMFTISERVFHSHAMENVIGEMLRYFLPAGQDFVVKNMSIVAHARSGVQIVSLVMLLISSTGVFLPLEVALNQVWGVPKNRSYLMNQLVSLSLAIAVGVLALCSVAATAGQNTLLTWLFFGHTDNVAFRLIGHSVLQLSAVFMSVMLFFLIYWVLPNRKLPIRAVLPAAIVTGLLWELAKVAYVAMLPWLDFRAAYGPFSISVSLMLWAFVSGLLMLAGAHFSATRYTIHLARQSELEKRLPANLKA